ncbi:MAG: VWA domain-containing protein [Planctomycetes bacterium]|nr:VWA domain-containing protein [Planctomycetota bacterium]
MTLLAPGMLWFGLLLAPLAAVYLLKVRPVRRPTATLFLWDTLLRETSSRTLLRRLRDLLSLLMMALAMTAVVGALARPVPAARQDRRDLVLLLDVSASMSSGPGRSRLDQAKAEARRIIRALDADRRASLATVAGELRTVVSRTADHRSLLDGLDAVACSTEPLDPAALQSLARNADLRRRCRVILLTDGCFEGAGAVEGIELLRLGAGSGNIGIAAADLLPAPDGLSMEVYVQVISSHDVPRDADLLICRDSPDRVVKVVPLQVRPGANPPQIIHVEPAGPGRWLVRLDPPDALDADNTAWLVAAEPRPIAAALAAARGGFFFEQCLQAFGQQRLLALSEAPELLITSALPVDADAAGRHVIFGPTGQSPFWEDLGPAASDAPARLRVADHPAVRFCDLEAVPFVGQRRLKPPDGSVVIADSLDGVPLVYEAFVSDRRAIVVNLDPQAADLPLSVEFPILIHQMARHVTGAPEAPPAALPAGRPWRAGSSGALRIRTPSGRRIEAAPGESPRLNELGFHDVDGPRGRESVAVSLLSPVDSLPADPAVRSTAGPIRRGWSARSLLAAGALVIVAVECMLYHRRKVG